jgi:hypothetical protein
MKTIIAGSRDISDINHVRAAVLHAGFEITEVVSGAARGIDRLGEDWATEHSIPIVRYPADWNKHGKSAGYLRNQQMADYADALIAVWDGSSRGTNHMVQIMRKAGKPVFVFTP